MLVKKHNRGIFVLLPALFCLSTLTKAEVPETNTSVSEKVAAPKAGTPTRPSTAYAQPASAASSAASNPDEEGAPPATRSLFPNGKNPSVDPTQPWPRSGAADESK
jgi:hypothetical protein